MKWLLITLLFSFGTHATAELSPFNDQELTGKFINVVRDVEVQGKIGDSAEFIECQRENQFEAGANPNRVTKAKKASDCFETKLRNRSEADLKKLSDNLNLQNYGLIKSNSAKDITRYLTNKMYETMTGVDLGEQDLKEKMRKMKFSNKRLLDQTDFLTMYRSQIIKNTLFEISRFCFNDLRLNPPATGTPPDKFQDHWASAMTLIRQDPDANPPVGVNDTGAPAFTSGLNVTGNQVVYEAIKTSIYGGSGSEMSPQDMGAFFNFCMKQIRKLCDSHESTVAGKVQSDANAAFAIPSAGTSGKACITKARLQSMRKGLADTNLILTHMNTKNSEQDNRDFGIKLTENYERFNGQNGQPSLESLTNHSSADILQAQITDEAAVSDAARVCREGTDFNSEECQKFIVQGDSRERLEHTLNENYLLKKQVELARIKKLTGDSLETYLSENGYLGLLDKVKKGQAVNLEEEISKVFDARREAALSSIQKTVGQRQLSDDEAAEPGALQKAQKSAEETQSERQRLAQVVLFNNIITSNLTLATADGETVGSNRGALDNELRQIAGAQVESSLFENLKEAPGASNNGTDSALENITFIDQILGAPASP